MALPAFNEYSDERAVEFYLGHDGDDTPDTADACFMVEGRVLPVHSHVLAGQSGVLRMLFDRVSATVPLTTSGHGSLSGSLSSSASLGSSYHLATDGRHLDLVCSDSIPALTGPGHERSLEGYTLKRVVHFLRFMYRPDEVSRLDFALPGAAKTLSACARLACQLDAPALLELLDLRMELAVGAHQATLQRLIDWTQVAEECDLKRLWTKCIRGIALTLARCRSGVTGRTMSSTNLAKLPSKKSGAAAALDDTELAANDVALLKDISIKAHLAVMATLLAALRRMPGDPSDLVPAEASLAGALPTLPEPDSPNAVVA